MKKEDVNMSRVTKKAHKIKSTNPYRSRNIDFSTGMKEGWSKEKKYTSPEFDNDNLDMAML